MAVHGSVRPDSVDQWRDRKRYLWLTALAMPLIPFAAMALFSLTDQGVWLWLGPIVILGLVPLIDWVTGRDDANPPDELIDALENDRYYRWITFAFLPVQYVGLLVGLWFIVNTGLTTPEKVGLAVTLGFIGGLGINTAHELGHKKEKHERWLAKIALAPSIYGHFYIEHNRGHHVRVATPNDPASSRLGESFYEFLPRTVVGSLVSAWRLEKARIGRRGRHPFRLSNDVVNAWFMTAALWFLILIWLGWSVLPYLLIQAAIAIALLEAVNYLEHYGMLRQKVATGDRERYEQVQPRHSWNSNNTATNVLLYHLQRHSDHHAQPTRRYQALRDYEESPALPTGYAGMILLALAPPLWFRVMDPRVAEHFDGDLSRAHVQPRRRRKLRLDDPVAEAHMARVASASAARAASGVHACPGCGYHYDEGAGDAREGFLPGTAWSRIPVDWCCPDCGVRTKEDFIAVAN